MTPANLTLVKYITKSSNNEKLKIKTKTQVEA